MKKNKPKFKPKNNYSPAKALSIFLFLFAFFLYANTISHEFTLDDDLIISKNQLTQQGFQGIPELFVTAYRFGFSGSNHGLYRPLSPVTFAIEYQLFGLNPHGFHFINVLLYALTAVVLFRCLCLLFNVYSSENKISLILSFIITCLFTAHPVHTEVVASVKSRDEILAFLMIIASMYFVLKSYRLKISNNNSSWKYTLLSCLCFFLALLSKESAITYLGILPFVFILFMKQDVKRAFVMLIPYLISLLFYLIAFYFSVDTMVGTGGISIINNSIVATDNVLEQFATKMYILLKYIWLLIFPHPLVFDYSYNHIPNLQWYDLGAIVAYVFYLGLIVFAFYHLWKTIKNKSTGENFYSDSIVLSIIFFLVSLSIVSNVFILIEATMAERFLYTPSLGFCIVLGIGICKFVKLNPLFQDLRFISNKKLIVILIPILICYSYKTISRNFAWKDNFTLYKTDIQYLQNSARANYSLGSVYLDQAKKTSNVKQKSEAINEAVKYLEKSIEIFPEYHSAYINLSNAYSQLNRYKEAIEYLKKMVAIDTTFENGFFQLAITYYNSGDYENTIASAERLLKLSPSYYQAYNLIGLAYKSKKIYDMAIQSFSKAIHIYPDYADSKNNLKNTYLDLGIENGKNANYDVAISYFHKAIEVKPRDAEPYINLGIVYAQLSEFDKAIEQLKKAMALDPDKPDIYQNLGVAYQQLGDIAAANKYFNMAKSLSGK